MGTTVKLSDIPRNAIVRVHFETLASEWTPADVTGKTPYEWADTYWEGHSVRFVPTLLALVAKDQSRKVTRMSYAGQTVTL